jgi:hypothetical protein
MPPSRFSVLYGLENGKSANILTGVIGASTRAAIARKIPLPRVNFTSFQTLITWPHHLDLEMDNITRLPRRIGTAAHRESTERLRKKFDPGATAVGLA